jgi:hypothetical protein
MPYQVRVLEIVIYRIITEFRMIQVGYDLAQRNGSLAFEEKVAPTDPGTDPINVFPR